MKKGDVPLIVIHHDDPSHKEAYLERWKEYKNYTEKRRREFAYLVGDIEDGIDYEPPHYPLPVVVK